MENISDDGTDLLGYALPRAIRKPIPETIVVDGVNYPVAQFPIPTPPKKKKTSSKPSP